MSQRTEPRQMWLKDGKFSAPLKFVYWLFRKDSRDSKATLILQVVEKHASWFPLYNGGREAPATARLAWAKALQRLSCRELLHLLRKHQLRDHLLGRNWPPVE